MTEIVKATLADEEDVAQLIRELGEIMGVTGEVDAAAWYQTLRRMLASPEWIFLLAEEDGKRVGLLVLLILPSLYYGGNSALITEMVVTEGYRGKGTGQMLVNEARRIGRAQACEEILFSAKVATEEAIRFFEKLGFEKRLTSYAISV